MLRLRSPRQSSAVLIVITLVSIVQSHGDSLQAQQGPSASQSAPTDAVGAPTASSDLAVPPLIPYSGQLHAAAGKSLTAVVAVEFSVYDEQLFGTRLWNEVQNVQLDQNGRFSALLGAGSPDGIPVDLFTNAGQRWLEAHAVGQADEPRTLMVSVPYAVKAQDAATLGGKPASAYMLVQPEERSTAGSSVTASTNQLTAAAPSPGPSGGVTATQFTSTNSTGPSFISQATSGPPLQVTSTAVNTNLNADLIDGFDSSAFPKLTVPNIFTATQTIDNGNVDLDASTAITGNITKNGTLFLHNFGTSNTFLGLNAGNVAMSGNSNTSVGVNALFSNTSGNYNAATGTRALSLNTSGISNAAFGYEALERNSTGNNNTAVGQIALASNTVGSNNTAIGNGVLLGNVTGSNNVAVGINAGYTTTGSNNIYLGAFVRDAVPGESNTMRLGNTNPALGATVAKTVVAGVRGTAVTGAEMVVIDPDGRLGSAPTATATNTVGSAEVIDDSLTASDLGPGSVAASELAADAVTADKVEFNYAASTSEGGAALDLACLACVGANEVSFNFASLGPNTFTGAQTIDVGNLDLDPSTATTGNITKNGTLFLHNFGTDNTFLGINAGNLTTTGPLNTASGFFALSSLTTGSANTGSGWNALRNNTTGYSNTAIGAAALYDNTAGHHNTVIGEQAARYTTTGWGNIAVGSSALESNTTGELNTANGTAALSANTAGNLNVALGYRAGSNATTGSNNIYVGANILGVEGESDTMYLGLQGTHTKTVIAGIRGTTVIGGEMVVIDADGRLGSAPIGAGADSVGSAQVVDDSLTASDLAPNSVTTSELAPDSVTSAKVAFNYAAGTSEAGAALDLACLGCVAANEVSFSFAGLGNNTFTGTQTIGSGNLDFDQSTATTGNLTKNGQRFLHNFGTDNTFLGISAGNVTMTGQANTGAGTDALLLNTTGGGNTAIGARTLRANTSAFYNTALGNEALRANTTGPGNTAIGHVALVFNTTGSSNTASGDSALASNTSGSFNAALGYGAGSNATTGVNNIYLGANVIGVAGESNTIYLGKQGTQTKTVIAGIRGTTTVNADAIPVVIDSAGQLGTISSSRRFKEDIRDMGSASERVFQLRPVTFRYTRAYRDGSKPVQYGLVAEEVAQVFPELAVRNTAGDVETVHYETLNVLLLNEVQRQEQTIRDQEQRIEALEIQLQRLLHPDVH